MKTKTNLTPADLRRMGCRTKGDVDAARGIVRAMPPTLAEKQAAQLPLDSAQRMEPPDKADSSDSRLQ